MMYDWWYNETNSSWNSRLVFCSNQPATLLLIIKSIIIMKDERASISDTGHHFNSTVDCSMCTSPSVGLDWSNQTHTVGGLADEP